ncbi:MAG: MaoC family dehydratase [Pseudomonadota bacterium]
MNTAPSSPSVSVQCRAINYAKDSANRIHSDEYAAAQGFKGGLVPGVGDFAYLARAALQHFGPPLLEGSQLSGKFIKPVYDGELVTSQGVGTDRLELQLLNEDNVVCAIGAASLTPDPEPERNEFSANGPPELMPPSLEEVRPGQSLQPYQYRYQRAAATADARAKFGYDNPLFVGPSASWHPALCLHDANQMLRRSIALDAWIHTGSVVSYFRQPHDGELLSWLGTIAKTYEKRGNIVTEADLALFGEDDRSLVRVHHTAIIAIGKEAAA